VPITTEVAALPGASPRLLGADLASLASGRDGSPGSIMAALFLREFAGELSKGGTGFGVRLLLDLMAP
jgi:leucyl aminopeptidase